MDKCNVLMNENTCRSIDAFSDFVSDEDEGDEYGKTKWGCCNIS